MATKDHTIYAKIDKSIAEKLKVMADGRGKSQAAFLAEIITYFARVYEAARKAAEGGGADKKEAERLALRDIEKQIASDHDEIHQAVSTLEDQDRKLLSVASTVAFFTGKNASAEHSFTRGWYPWTIESYTEIIERIDRLKEKGEQRGFMLLKEARALATFRLGFCWTRMALGLRKECLESYLNEPKPRLSALFEGYSAAMNAAATAATYFREMNSNLDGDRESPVGYYNYACLLSISCQYAVERALMATDDRAKVLAENILDRIRTTGEKDSLLKKEAKEDYVQLKGWRDLDRSFTDRIDAIADRAFEMLDKVPTRGAFDRNRFPAESGWLVELAFADSDLNFLKNESPYRERYETWKHNWEGGNSARQSYEALSKLLDSDVDKGARTLIAELTVN